MHTKTIALLTILGFTLLTACGQKGDLYIPVDPEVAAAAKAAAEAEALANGEIEETQEKITTE